MVESSSCSARPVRGGLRRRTLLLATAFAAVLVLFSAVPAFAGQASSGELLFYPCTSCHPVLLIPGTEKPAKPLPNNFQGHEIALVGHDKLGKGEAACGVCHDDPFKNPGMLKAIDGTLVDIKGDVSLVCYRCHSTKYKEFKAGTHGKHKASCVAGGCHDPHTPGFMYAGPTMPFIGTGFQFKVLSVRAPFMPLASPAPAPAVVIPSWFFVVGLAGLVAVVGLAGTLVLGRSKR
jgi:hypothetical protein